MNDYEFYLQTTVKLLLETESWSVAIEQLTEAKYWKDKASHGMAPGLLEELTSAVENAPHNQPGYQAVMGLQRALERELYFLIKHPSAMLQCIYNLCAWHGYPNIESYFDPPERETKPRANIWQNEGPQQLYREGKPLPPVRRESWMTDEMLRRSSGWVSAGTNGICHEAICPACGNGGVFGSGNYSAELRVQFASRKGNQPAPIDRWGSSYASLDGIVNFVVLCCEACDLGSGDTRWLHFIPYQYTGWTRENVIEYLNHIKSPLATHALLKCIPSVSGKNALRGMVLSQSESENRPIIPDAESGQLINASRVDLQELSDADFPEVLSRWIREMSALAPGHVWLRSVRPPLIWPGAGRRHTLFRHNGAVTGVAVIRDSQRVISTSMDGTLRIANAHSGHQIALANYHKPLTALAVNQGGTLCITGSASGIQVWEILGDRIDFRYSFKCESEVNNVCWSRCGGHFAAATNNGGVYCWNTSKPGRHGYVRIESVKAIGFCGKTQLAAVEDLNVVKFFDINLFRLNRIWTNANFELF